MVFPTFGDHVENWIEIKETNGEVLGTLRRIRILKLLESCFLYWKLKLISPKPPTPL